MKKLNLFLASILALFAGVFFSACDKDSIKVDFAQDEIVRSVDEQIKLDDLISVKGITKSSIEYKIAKSSAFEFDPETSILTAKESGFSSFVYATYRGNILDGMNVVIKTSFSAPDVQTFVFEGGYLKWNKVADYFENSQTPTTANRYLVEGTLTTYALDNPDQETGTQEIRQETNDNKYALSQSGQYAITIKALGAGYFADSAKSDVWTKKIGYINTISNLTWNDGILTWQDENTRADYRVKVSNGISDTLFDIQQTKTLDISTYFENATAGAYAVSVISYDKDGVLIANESEAIEITKLSTPSVEYVFDETLGGRLKASPLSNATSIRFDFEKAGETITISVPLENEDVYSVFDTLAAGEYQTYAYAVGGANTFKSSKISLGTTIKLQTPSITGLGENVENGSVLNIKVSTTENQTTATKIVANTQVLAEEIEIGEKEVSTSVSLSQTGVQTLNFILKPKTTSSTASVLNSAPSADFVVTKLAQISGSITHSQTALVSSFTFGPVENATDYQIFVETGAGYVLVPDTEYTLTIDQTATCEFDEKIEDMFDAIEKNSNLVYSFRVVALADPTTSIPSSTTKVIEVLAPPQALETRQSTQKSIEWQEVSGAESYRVELYTLNAAQYQEYQTNGETTLGVPTITTVDTNSLAVANVGYYLVRIYSISDDVDAYINSENCLEAAFCVSEKLELESVEFGFKDEYIAPIEFASATGYFLRVEKPENAYQFSVTIDQSSTGVMKFSESEDYIIYLFGIDFEPVGAKTSYEISVVASGEDSNIYLDTDEKVLTISKLAPATKQDISFSEGPGHGKTSSVVLTAIENASAAQIWREGYKSTTLQTGAESATFNMLNLNNANIVFNFKGTPKDVNGIYQSDENIFIDSEEAIFTFTRLDAPTELAYYDGSITFNSTLSISPTTYEAARYYVLEISDGSNPTATPFEVVFDTIAKIVYNGVEAPLGDRSNFITTASNTITINIRSLIALVKISPFAQIYTNMTNVVFRVYAWQAKFHQSTNNALLSTNYASTKFDPTSNVLQIQRVPTATLSAQINGDLSVTLSVAGVNVHEDYKNDTSYQLFENNQTKGAAQVSGGASINWNLNNLTPSTEYRYKVVVSNPYYLESKDSNVLTLYKLSQITSLTIGTDGTASYLLGAADAERYSRVKVVYDNGATETTTYSTNGKFSIAGAGIYTLSVLGSNEQGLYVIDSDPTTFTFENMSALMPIDTAVGFSNNALTWNAFAAGQSLDGIFEYVVSFDDGENVVSVSTNTNSLNLLSNESLAELASQLSAGTLTIRVYARLKTYTAGGPILYFGPQITLLDGQTTAFNYCAYTDLATIKKLSTPDITNVVFISPVSGTQPNAGSITPNINIVFEGNYGAQGTFEIYINGTKNDQAETITKVSNTYTYTLTASDYNATLDAGETLVVEIQATSQYDIPSALGRVEIVRANDIAEIEFTQKSDGSLEKEVVVTFENEAELPDEDFSSSIGGVVFEIKYKAAGETNYTTEYVAASNGGATLETLSYDLSSLIDTNLSAGGVVTIRAFTNSYSNSTNGVYYLSSPQYVATQETTILKRLSSANITQNSRGFTIAPTINPNATYVVSYGGQSWEVEKEDDQYFFEYPDAWDPDTYSVDIYAKENGKINSASVSVSLNLSRMERITGFTLTRNPLNAAQTTISWTAPSGATAQTQYLFKVFNANDTTTSIYENTLSGTTFTLGEIFGSDYADLISGNFNRTDFVTAKNFLMQIITIGHDSVANSHAYNFNAQVVGNSVQINQIQGEEVINNIYVDELGYLWFDSIAGQTYIYRLLTGAGVEAQGWKFVEAAGTRTEIEIDKDINDQYLISDGTFNIEIIALGSATTSGVSSEIYGLKFDSIKASTYGADVGFIINDKLASISLNPDDYTKLLFEATSDSAFTKIIVGTSTNAVKSGDVVEISIEDEELEELGVATNPTNYLYAFPVLTLVDRLRAEGLLGSSNQTLYFWAYRDTEGPEASYVISNPYAYELTIETLDSYKMIMKPGTEFFTAATIDYRADGQQNPDAEDYDNTFALFDNNDPTDLTDTIGIYTKITQIIEEGDDEPIEKIIFLTKAELLAEDYFNNSVFAINITKLFETEDFAELVGRFKLQFLTIKTQNDAVIISNWLSLDENTEEFVFQRMESPTEVRISSGNLAWTNNSALSEEYYVYFYGAIKESAGYVIDESSINRGVSVREIFDASNQVGDGEAYFIAVQSISKNTRILSSKRVFKTHIVDSEARPQVVVKNQIKQKLTLEGGSIKLKWQNGIDNDMYDLMFVSQENLDKIATQFYSNYFQSPFTFNIPDLVNDKITIRFGFTDITSGTEGARKTIDINAKFLLTDFVDYIKSLNASIDYSQIRDKLSNINTVLSDKIAINKFIALIGKETNGIGTQRKLFDSVFERIQTGKYKIEYCLLGGDNTLTSNWYSFENENHENIACVNAEPSMSAKKVNLSNTENAYKLLIKKSQIYKYEGGNYVLADAPSYVVKFTQNQNFFAFAITYGISEYSMCLSEGYRNTTNEFIYGDGSSISVYETNEDGEEVVGGDYLMVYLNLNNGNSLLGTFSDYIGKFTYDVEAYAVGNNYSISSKSSLYHITFAGFGVDDNMNLEVVNGVFRWSTYMGRDTTVAYKSSGSVTEEVVVVKGGSATSEFTLNTGAGLYETIKFVNIGEIIRNSVIVDSEIYQIKNVYKLNVANLVPKLGTIEIKENSSNSSVWENCYTTSEGLKYKVTNDMAQGDYIIVTNERGMAQNLYYEVGTTGISSSDADYDYKASEADAGEFDISSLGSNASLRVNTAETTAQKYYLRTIYPIDNTEVLLTTKSVAISSNPTALEAKMLSEITGIAINNGLLTWDAYEDEDITLSGVESVVYRIAIEQFKESYGISGQSSTSTAETIYIYTTNTTFDFKDITLSDETTSLKATIQVFVAKTSPTTTATYKKQLLEGGYVFDNANFTDSTPALMSNGVVKSGIQRLAPIDENSLRVEDGKLVWNYTTTEATENNFSTKFSFVVEDENNNKVDGTFTAIKLLGGDTFKITFTEQKGKIPEGVHTFKVYTTQGSQSTTSTIKSIPTTIEDVEKLAVVENDDYEIDSFEYSNSGNVFRYEVLTLKPYFDRYQYSEIAITFVNLRTSAVYSFTLTKDSDDVYIFRSEADEALLPSANSILLKTNDTYKMTMAVSKTGANILFADPSDEFTLSRANWDEESISWNETSQQFEWDFDYFKVKTGTQVVGAETILDGTGTYTIVSETTDRCTISNGEDEYTINKTDLIAPVFVVTATYSTTTRTYQTTEKYFKPTITGNVSVSIVVKFGKTNVESNAATTDFVEFDLFASGDGTRLNPYSITTAQQFKNIAHRMTKDNYLNYYISNGAPREDVDKKYYFTVANDIDLSANETQYTNGILFRGEFGGVINGAVDQTKQNSAPTIKYMSEEVARPTRLLNISAGNSRPAGQTIEYASALFDVINENAEISNLNISAYFGDKNAAETGISYNAIICGLAITNQGSINSVNLISFTSKLYLNFGGGYIFYAGIVGANLNQAIISNCKVQTDMIVLGNATNAASIAVAGIAHINSATIENCATGTDGENNYMLKVQSQNASDIIQVAGICTTQTASGTMTNCSSYFNIQALTGNPNMNVVYIARLADYMTGNRTIAEGTESLGSLVVSEGESAPATLNRGALFAYEPQ